MSNATEFDKGIKKFRAAMEKQLSEAGRQLMWEILVDAIGNYAKGKTEGDKYLTGNTINAFACGLYLNGRLIKTAIARDAGVEPPTSNYATVGKAKPDYYEHRYGQLGGEHVTYTYQYSKDSGLSFQKVPNGRGDDDARQFLKDFKNVGKKGFTIVVCNAVPYAEYLKERRLFDILVTTHRDTEALAEQVFKQTNRL